MKRYLLFEWEKWDACGGANDFTRCFATLDEAKGAPRSDSDKCAHIAFLFCNQLTIVSHYANAAGEWVDVKDAK